MTNIEDYIRWRGDLTFSQDPPNAIDCLIFSYLVYIRFPDSLLSQPEQERPLRLVQEELSRLPDVRERGNAHQLELLREAGFNYYTVFRQRKPEFIKL